MLNLIDVSSIAIESGASSPNETLTFVEVELPGSGLFTSNENLSGSGMFATTPVSALVGEKLKVMGVEILEDFPLISVVATTFTETFTANIDKKLNSIFLPKSRPLTSTMPSSAFSKALTPKASNWAGLSIIEEVFDPSSFEIFQSLMLHQNFTDCGSNEFGTLTTTFNLPAEAVDPSGNATVRVSWANTGVDPRELKSIENNRQNIKRLVFFPSINLM